MARIGRVKVAVATAIVSVTLMTAGCSGSSTPKVEQLPTSAGVVKDSIEDVNSTKDMTGVVTKYSGDNNPYFALMPDVCKFLPKEFFVKYKATSEPNTGGVSSKLFRSCAAQSDAGTDGSQFSITVRMQALSFDATTKSDVRTILERNIDLGSGVRGTTYKGNGDDTATNKVCNLAWGTFYGSAVVTVIGLFGYPIDSCSLSTTVARDARPFLPSKPIQMRPSE